MISSLKDNRHKRDGGLPIVPQNEVNIINYDLVAVVVCKMTVVVLDARRFFQGMSAFKPMY
jgi:hypothetical protein